MSKRSTSNKKSKNISNNINTNNKSPNNNQYNVIINQNSTFNQDNSINIMLDGTFPYFQNYNYQQNDTDPSNQIYPFYPDYQSKIEKNNINDPQNKNTINNVNKNNIKEDNSFDSPQNSKKKSKKINHRKNDKSLLSDKQNDDQSNQRSTNKIDYRYIKKCPIKEIISTYKDNENDINNKQGDDQQFWFATYGKLMKTKHLIKILNYYNNNPLESSRNHYSNINLKEKTLVIRDFDIYFYENSNKPFIKYTKGGTIYTKLYLLTLKEISLIFSYLNRIEYKINYDILNYLQRKGTFKIINDNSNGIILPYCLIYCLGKYMNINIFSFSNNIDFNVYLDELTFEEHQRISSYTVINNNTNNYFNKDNNHHTKMNNTNIKFLNYKLPSSKKIAKLIKIINLNFPEFSIEEIINYLIPDNKYINSITKINEIKNIFFFKQQNLNKIILSSMVRDTIKGISIQTPKSLFSSFCPAESIIDNGSFKNSDLFQPMTNKKYPFPIKDDYKFQTISTNEKDNNKNNPFIIYIADNIQKISFNDNKGQTQNQTQSQNINVNNNNNNNTFNFISKNNTNKKIANKNKNNEKINDTNTNTNTNQNSNVNINNKKEIITHNYKTDNIQQNKKNENMNIKNQINNNNNYNSNNTIGNENNNQINNVNNIDVKSKKILKDKLCKQKKSIDTKKMKQMQKQNNNTNNKVKININDINNNVSNIFTSGNKKKIKIQRISTDVRKKKNIGKYNTLTGTNDNCKNKTRDSTTISHANLKIDNVNNKNSIRLLNKSIESHNNYTAKFRLSKMSDISQIKNQKPKNYNNTMLLKRVNVTKKDNNNPFFVPD